MSAPGIDNVRPRFEFHQQVNATWAKHCDILLFMTTEHHAGLNTVVLTLGEKEDRHFLWRKSILSWSFLYVHFLQKAEWFMRADDDSFVNMDTMRSFLSGRREAWSRAW